MTTMPAVLTTTRRMRPRNAPRPQACRVDPDRCVVDLLAGVLLELVHVHHQVDRDVDCGTVADTVGGGSEGHRQERVGASLAGTAGKLILRRVGSVLVDRDGPVVLVFGVAETFEHGTHGVALGYTVAGFEPELLTDAVEPGVAVLVGEFVGAVRAVGYGEL